MRAWLPLALAAASTGCSTYATINRTDGLKFDAKITKSDPQFIHVESDEYGEGVVPRNNVKDIDHPGNVAAIVGTTLTAVGAIFVGAGIGAAGSCGGDLCGFFHVFFTIPGAGVAAAGLPPAIWGWAVWANSKSAAAGHDDTPHHDPFDDRAAAGPTQFKFKF